jgi:hypothetical protein
MTARCIKCRAKIGEGPLCADCATRVANLLKRRPQRRDYYRHEPRQEPPITLPTVRFGKTNKGDAR